MTTALRTLLQAGPPARLVGAHDGLTALLIERSGFEGIWASGLAISSSHGVPDAGILTMTEMYDAAARMRHVTALPIVADVDSGFGDDAVVRRMVRIYADAGVDAVCIEDKRFPKRNSFQPGNELETPSRAAERIATAKDAQGADGCLVIARQESLIAGAGMDDAEFRGQMYRDAGADALLIHSRLAHAGEISEYCDRMRFAGIDLPILAIPTTYHTTSARELSGFGISGVIYANQLVRASVRAIQEVLASISGADVTTPIEGRIATLSELFDLVDMDQPAVALTS